MSNIEQNSNQTSSQTGVSQPNRPQQRPAPRKPKMRLPFDNRKKDAGEWAYDHRLGLSVMVIAYLILGIAFFSSKIIIGSRPHTQGIYVDLQTLEELEKEKERLQREIELKKQQDIEWSKIRNLQSNDAVLNEELKDDRNSNTAALNEAIKSVAEGYDIICQCEYGQSRSAACAAAIKEHYGKRGIEIFADYRYYPNQLVFNKLLCALKAEGSENVSL